MRKMDRVFEEKGIIYEADEYTMMKGPEYDNCQRVVDIVGDIIVTVFYSGVLDPMFNLYDRKSLEFIAQQNVYPEYQWFDETCLNPWMVAVEL